MPYRQAEHMFNAPNCPPKVPMSENTGAIKQAVSQVSTLRTNARVCPIYSFYDYEKSSDILVLDYISVYSQNKT